MSGSGGSGNTTTRSISEPSKYVQPYLAPYMEAAAGAASTPYQAFQGQRIAELSPEQLMGSNMTAAQSLNGFQGQNDAMGNYQATMRGDFMNPDSNPWLAANAQKAMGDISSAYRSGTKPQTDSAASRAGAFGGSAWQQMVGNNERQLGDSLGAAANQFYGQNYINERNNQMQGLNMMPMLQNLGYTDSQKLTGVGDNYRQYQQDLLNTQFGDWQEAQNHPYKMLDIMGNAISRTMGGGGSTTQTGSGGYKPSPFASAIGGGLAGYGMGGPVGGLLGGIGGMIL